MVLKMRDMSCLNIFKYFIDLECWRQGWDEKRDTAKDWILEELQYQAVGMDLNIKLWNLKSVLKTKSF